jgi:hypothetical protein
LDELPGGALAEAICALNRSLLDDDRLIVTSRTEELARAAAVGTAINSAAALQAQPVTPAQAARYLRRCHPRGSAATWTWILDGLDSAGPAVTDGEGGPWSNLASVTATPLRLWLLGAVYSAGAAGASLPDPAELADPGRYRTPADLWAYLLDHWVAAVITRLPGGGSTGPSRLRHCHDPARVTSWLTCLAGHLGCSAIGGPLAARDLAWWDLAAATMSPGRMSAAGGLIIGLLLGIWGGLHAGIAAGVAFALAGTFAGWQYVRRAAPRWLRDEPGYANFTLRGRGRQLIRRVAGQLAAGLSAALLSVLTIGLMTGAAAGLTGGIVFGLAAGLIGGEFAPARGGQASAPGGTWRADRALTVWRSLVVGLGLGLGSLAAGKPGDRLILWLVNGLLYGLATGLIRWAEVPAPGDGASTPASTWRADRNLTIWRVAVLGLMFGVAGGLASGPVNGLVVGLGLGLVTGLGGGQHHAWWCSFQSAILGSRRELPRDLMGFLDEAHHLGLLRTVGPVYQFRHAEFQDHLAGRRHNRATPDSGPSGARQGHGGSRTGPDEPTNFP